MRVAFVTQRCGIEVNGGAEAVCRDIAIQMSRHWDVEILTTCALDYQSWANHYQPGAATISGVPVRRFPVETPRDVTAFDKRSQNIVSRIEFVKLPDQEKWMRAQGPWSPDLIRYIEKNASDYDAFFFFGYLYAQTYFALPSVADKAVLVPFAHDEWMIKLSMFDRVFELPRKVVFSTPAEKRFIERRFPTIDTSGPVIGTGVDFPGEVSAGRFRERHGLTDPFLLYVGRIDESKGCGEMFDHFIALRAEEQRPRKLVLIGRSVMDIPDHPDIVTLGFVDEQTKWDAFAAADIVLMPSPFESLSISLMEGWASGKAALVNGRCDVLVDQCRRAQGGLWYDSYDEFRASLQIMDGETAAALGGQGREFVLAHYAWPEIEKKYLSLLA